VIPRHLCDLFAMYAEEMITATRLTLEDLNEAWELKFHLALAHYRS